jgi:hypothetical protein
MTNTNSPLSKKRQRKCKYNDGHSKQYRWQLKKKLEGKCMICGKDSVSHTFCAEHQEARRTQMRNWQRRKRGIPLDAPLYTRSKSLVKK